MAVVTKQVLIETPIERFYELVVDYPRYPEFVPGIKACRVRNGGAEKHVEYELDLGVKRLRYVLRMEETRPRRVAWSLVSGEMMKVSNGSWDLADENGRTRALYSVEIQIARPPLVPQALIDRVSDELTKVQLPRTLEAFKARAERRP
jgi:ribosome-associated toxin RatA of RatAB toxin-antitoxin module